MDEARLLRKLRDLEALFAGATTEGERVAAGNARDRILARLREAEDSDPPIEYRFTMRDRWSQRLFLALARRYGLSPYRYRGQRYTTVMVRAPRGFVDSVLWPHFERASAELRGHLDEVAARVIAEAMQSDAGEAEEKDPTQKRLPFESHE